MLSSEEQELILNPIGKDPILKVSLFHYREELRSRLIAYVVTFLRSKEVYETFEEIKDDLVTFREETSDEILELEKIWVDKSSDSSQNATDGSESCNTSQHRICGSGDDDISTGAVVGVMVATSPIWIPLLAIGLAAVVGAAGLSLALSPIIIPVQLILGREERRKKIIEKEYKAFRDDEVRTIVRNQLTENTGLILEMVTDKVILELKRKIEALNESTKKLLKSRKDIIAKVNILQNQNREIETMKKMCRKLQQQLN